MKTNKLLSDYPEKFKIGVVEGAAIYLSAPSWDCGWYWGFGYLGNKNTHYHVEGLKTIETYHADSKRWSSRRVNLFDGFKAHFGESFKITDRDLWTLSELFQTFYTLKETAEVLGRGGSHLSANPCADFIKNVREVERINEIVLPEIFEAIYKILRNAEANFKIENAEKIRTDLERRKEELLTLKKEVARLDAVLGELA